MNNTINGLTELSTFIDEMNLSSSSLHKIKTIEKHKTSDFLKKIFHYTYNHFKKYGVHSKVLKKNAGLVSLNNDYNDLFSLLDDLAKDRLTGYAAIQAVNSFIYELPPDLQKFVYFVLDRDLRMGASITSILKIHPNIVPQFKVALAHPYTPNRVDFAVEEWYGSRKLDGVRCICRKDGDKVTFYSRNGKEFETLGVVEAAVKDIDGDFVLDGEICMVNDLGVEDFQGIMKEIRRKNHTIKNPKFLIFDCLTLDEFDSCYSNVNLSNRLNRRPIEHIKNTTNNKGLATLSLVDQVLITAEDDFIKMVDNAERLKFEGIMLRKNVGYDGTRSHNLLKVKKFHDDEYTIVGCVNGTIRWTENGQQIEKECLSSIIIEHKGTKVSVGSGFSKEQREYYLDRHNELIGRTACIQYFEETQNASGGISLRFPVIKYIYNKDRDC